jgi:hypothetical protein
MVIQYIIFLILVHIFLKKIFINFINYFWF